ncbi:MAG: DNA-directed RNA polymerase subunit N [Candidatus Poseidoniales archaeon]|jgi:DNA-directed RNA polymerase subunit N (RpoN/RPB10)
MIIPVRCFSCGGLIAHKWEEFSVKKDAGIDVAVALDEVGLDRYCCRRMFVSHLDLIFEVAPFSKARTN